MKSDVAALSDLQSKLTSYAQETQALPGIASPQRKEVFTKQLLASIHRVQFVRSLAKQNLSPNRTDPSNQIFDPLRAASIHVAAGDLDEALWLAFLSVHFGKHRKGGWGYVKAVYGNLGKGLPWSWRRTSQNINEFKAWIQAEAVQLSGLQGCGYGNHRKYESVVSTADVVEDLVLWTHQGGGLLATSNDIVKAAPNAGAAFHALYSSIRSNIRRFGRLAAFDYTAMAGNLSILAVEPASPYFADATGPRKGARLLFGQEKVTLLEKSTIDLGKHLGVGMQVMEDALCNWQKQPDKYVSFRG